MVVIVKDNMVAGGNAQALKGRGGLVRSRNRRQVKRYILPQELACPVQKDGPGDVAREIVLPKRHRRAAPASSNIEDPKAGASKLRHQVLRGDQG